ncbi:hypothetical protein AGR8A_Lc10088 [Agrobacterium fabrum str. J-07]|nr:hypothetical protein AGR8A_Lc10088 [Agrobacterium fabrum str. J-07]
MTVIAAFRHVTLVKIGTRSKQKSTLAKRRV